MEDKIFKYLNSEMSEAEASEFENAMNASATLREQVEELSILKASMIVESSRKAMQKSGKASLIGWSIGAAASVMLMIGCSLTAYNAHNFNADLAAQQLSSMQITQTDALRSLSPEENALNLYNEGYKAEALSILSDIIANPGLRNPSDAMYIKGAILLGENGFSSEAVDLLEQSENPKAAELLDSLKLKFLY